MLIIGERGDDLKELIPDWWGAERFAECEVKGENNERDKRHPGVVVQMSRSTMLENIAMMVSDNVISMDDLEEFSDDLKAAVKLFVWGRR